MSEAVNHPKHYGGKIAPDVIGLGEVAEPKS
jgi:hypothetical protein